MGFKNWLQTIALAGFIFSMTSCRLGDLFRKADPETQEEIEREESIPENEGIENRKNNYSYWD